MATGSQAAQNWLAAHYQAALVRKLRRDGTLHGGPVEQAFRRVPRHLFVPGVDLDLAYRDVVIPTKVLAGEHVSSSSQPTIMAIMLEQLDARPGQNVLEVGAGTGFNAALLAEILGHSGRVTTIDLDEDTVLAARQNLATAGYARVRVEQVDGVGGFAESSPYDRIIATVGVGDIPLAWWAQLTAGGRLVLPLDIRGAMKAVSLRKDARGQLLSTSVLPAMFMPFRGASPLANQEVRLGPELGLFAWFPPHRDAGASAGLHGALQSTYTDLRTGVQLATAEFRNGLDVWIRAHEPSVFVLHAEGALVDAVPVPAFLAGPWAAYGARERLTLGLYAADQVALLGTASPGNADRRGPFELEVRAFGGRNVAEQLIECVRGWRDAGSPTDDQLQLRLVPHGGTPWRSAASIPLAAGVLEVTWGAQMDTVAGTNENGEHEPR